MAESRHDRATRLADARLYLCTGTRVDGDLVAFVEAVVRAGVDVVQFRDRRVDPVVEASELARLRDTAARRGALSAANDSPELARDVGTDILHVGQDDMPPTEARHYVPERLIGLSTRTPAQVDAAVADDDVDYFCVGPVWETPTKPGRPAVGLELIRYAADVAPPGLAKPWFAIGGINAATVDDVLAAGARRAVVVRAITEADDPAASAAELASRLRESVIR